MREFCNLTYNLSAIFRLSKSWSRKPFPYSHQKISWHAFLLDGSHVANEASMQDLAEADTMMATEGTESLQAMPQTFEHHMHGSQSMSTEMQMKIFWPPNITRTQTHISQM